MKGLTDFGESRSLLIQTQAVLSSKTTTVDRGTAVFIAPELLVKEKLTQNASVADLILADLWALWMIFFTMLLCRVLHCIGVLGLFRSDMLLIFNMAWP